jgi:DUF1365 family protein
MTASAIYTGTLGHHRSAPVEHRFEHRIGMLYLDLDELPDVIEQSRLWSATRRAPGRICRADLVGDPAVALDRAVGDEVQRQTGQRPAGPIRLLTMPRTFGRCFNPLTVYYCFDAAGAHVEFVLAEITNTPWRERHCYALTPQGDDPLRATCAKAFHVSPFLPAQLTYDWSLTPPGERLAVHVAALAGERRIFDATLVLQRHTLDRRGLAVLLARWPFAALRTLTLIYGHAAGVRLRGAPHFHHPARTGGP